MRTAATSHDTLSDKIRFRRIRLCMLLSGLSVFAQLYLFQPLLADLCAYYHVSAVTSSLAVSSSTIGMAVGLFVLAFKADTVSRTRLMSFSLLASSMLTLLSVWAVNFPLLLLANFLKGALLAGVSAVALAYLTEEVNASVIGLAISLYLSGNTLGGMVGRVSGTLLAGWADWHAAVLTIGFASLFLGLVFMRMLPSSRHFRPVSVSVRVKLRQMHCFLKNPSFMGVYLVAALAMGVFVSVYNYLPFLLESPVFELPHYVVAGVFLMYTAGVAGSVVMGRLSDKYSPHALLLLSLALMVVGLMLMLVMNLVCIVLGLGILTFAFFSTHTMASRIVSMQAQEARSSVTSLYWLFYYAGSSLLGSATGVLLTDFGWEVFVLGLTMLVAMAFVVASVGLSVRRLNLVKQIINS